MKHALQLDDLSVPEKIQVVEDLWDQIAQSHADIPIPKWQKDELARRKKSFAERPDSGIPWSDAKKSILNPAI